MGVVLVPASLRHYAFGGALFRPLAAKPEITVSHGVASASPMPRLWSSNFWRLFELSRAACQLRVRTVDHRRSITAERRVSPRPKAPTLHMARECLP